MSRKIRLLVAAVFLVIVAYFGYQYWHNLQNKLPDGIATGNGRIDATIVDISAKEPLRIKKIFFNEGDLVKKGDIVAVMDTTTLDSELETKKMEVLSSQEQAKGQESTIARVQSELDLAQVEVTRAKNLVEQRAGSQQELDVRNTVVQTTSAKLTEEQSKLATLQQQVKVAQAEVTTIQTRIDDATLRSPVVGRVLYKLAEEGEVLGGGGKVISLVNLEDVYMEIFLPAEQAAQVKLGAEGRIVVDYLPNIAIPGTVSFVSPEAQFTPKQVETKSEREKLMFRVKIKVPAEIVTSHIDSIKTGVRGVGYVRLNDTPWPASLQNSDLPPDTAGAKTSG